MQNNKLRMAIRATAAVTVLVLGLASQAQAFSFSAGDVDASLYGYARLNASYDMNADISDITRSGTFSAIEDTDEEGHFGASAAQSRLGLTTVHKSGVKINVEGDFYGSTADSRGNFRLRHAYGQYGNWLAGQTWSNYNSFVGNTSILDFNAAAGTAGYQLRTAQLRYTSGPFSVSVEDPKSAGIEDGDNRNSMPAFTARLEDSAGGMSYSVAALAKQVTHDNSDAVGGDDDSAIGFAVFGAAKMQLSDMISIQGAVNYTDGAHSYLYFSGGQDGYMNGNDLETISGFGASIGTGISLGGGRSINLGYGMTKADWDDAVDDGAVASADVTETNQNVFLNYQWTPVANTMMGIEYAYWETENHAGTSSDANRLMFAAQYNF